MILKIVFTVSTLYIVGTIALLLIGIRAAIDPLRPEQIQPSEDLFPMSDEWALYVPEAQETVESLS